VLGRHKRSWKIPRVAQAAYSRKACAVEACTIFPKGCSLLEVEGESPRYKIMYAPNALDKYVGMLRVSAKVYLVYGLYEEQHKNTWRKI